MPYKDLREYIERVDQFGELKRVDGADWDLEIGAIASITSLMDNPPALLFENIKGYPPGWRVYCDVFNGRKRLAEVLNLDPERPAMDWINIIKDRLSSFNGLAPVEVQRAPCQENILTGKDIDLYKIPVPRWFEGDGGRYLGTNDIVITKDPDTGWVNLGTYRVQLHDRNTAGIFSEKGKDGRLMMERYWAKGESCPIAVCLGQDPTLWIAGTQHLPFGHSEYEYAGWVKGAPIEFIKGPMTGLPIPASAEIVIEGEVPPPEVEQKMEGPFGEWEGYYASRASLQPVIKVKSVLHRNDPILCGLHRVRPHGGFYFNNLFSCAILWQQMEACGIPDIKGIWQMDGGGRMIFVISVRQRYAGHAQRAAHIATGGAGSYGGRFVILVDDDIDPSNTRDVLWAVATRCDPEHDIEILHGGWGANVDPITIIRGDESGSRAIIDACRPFNRIQDYPPLVSVSPELQERVMQRWRHVFDPL